MSLTKDDVPKVRGKLIFDESLSKYSYFKTGGIADALFKPADKEDLKFFLSNLSKDIPIFIIGGGANMLIRDGGIRGVVINLRNNFTNIYLDNQRNIIAESGLSTSDLYSFCRENEIGGFEFLSAIPGTIGGNIKMNAGCFESELKDFVLSVNAINRYGIERTFSVSECNFKYRKNELPKDLIYTSVVLKGQIKRSRAEIEEIQNNIMDKKISRQPYGQRTCGCAFKNPAEMPAWKVVQELGYQGKNVNGAMMSEKHGNFLVNYDNAKSEDLENLGSQIIEEANSKLGIKLEWELAIFGEK